MFDFTPLLSDNRAIALAAIILAATVYLCLHYGLHYMRIGLYKVDKVKKVRKVKGVKEVEKVEEVEKLPDSKLPPVSVVLTAHNDAAWLKENLVYLLEQDYPNFEVVVVDYLSQDDTQFVLKLLRDYYPHLKVVPFKEDVNLFQGKKYPLSIGIKSAKNDILLLADPDCTPKNLHWLRGMVKGYSENPEVQIVLGYCGLKRTKTLLGILQQYDNLTYSAHYLATALLRKPSTASGRNLSYRRSFFFKQGAFISHYNVADGSDDLFVYQNATRRNTAVAINPDAILTAEPQKSIAAWHRQRLHRVATRNRHSFSDRIMQDLPPIANVILYAAMALLLVLHLTLWPVVAAVLILKWAWQIVSFSFLTRRFDAGLVHLAAPFFELYFILANAILVLLPQPSNRKFKK